YSWVGSGSGRLYYLRVSRVSQMKKPRAETQGFLDGNGTVYLRNLRRAKPAKPIRPLPSSVIVPGSGTTEVGGPLEANPVLGPQFEPEAVQKWTTKPVN